MARGSSKKSIMTNKGDMNTIVPADEHDAGGTPGQNIIISDTSKDTNKQKYLTPERGFKFKPQISTSTISTADTSSLSLFSSSAGSAGAFSFGPSSRSMSSSASTAKTISYLGQMIVKSEPKEHNASRSSTTIFEESLAPALSLASASSSASAPAASSLNLYRIGFDPHAASVSAAAANNLSAIIQPATSLLLRGLGGGSTSNSTKRKLQRAVQWTFGCYEDTNPNSTTTTLNAKKTPFNCCAKDTYNPHEIRLEWTTAPALANCNSKCSCVLRVDGVVVKENVVLYNDILNEMQMQNKTDDNNNVTPNSVTSTSAEEIVQAASRANTKSSHTLKLLIEFTMKDHPEIPLQLRVTCRALFYTKPSQHDHENNYTGDISVSSVIEPTPSQSLFRLRCGSSPVSITLEDQQQTQHQSNASVIHFGDLPHLKDMATGHHRRMPITSMNKTFRGGTSSDPSLCAVFMTDQHKHRQSKYIISQNHPPNSTEDENRKKQASATASSSLMLLPRPKICKRSIHSSSDADRSEQERKTAELVSSARFARGSSLSFVRMTSFSFLNSTSTTESSTAYRDLPSASASSPSQSAISNHGSSTMKKLFQKVIMGRSGSCGERHYNSNYQNCSCHHTDLFLDKNPYQAKDDGECECEGNEITNANGSQMVLPAFECPDLDCCEDASAFLMVSHEDGDSTGIEDLYKDEMDGKEQTKTSAEDTNEIKVAALDESYRYCTYDEADCQAHTAATDGPINGTEAASMPLADPEGRKRQVNVESLQRETDTAPVYQNGGAVESVASQERGKNDSLVTTPRIKSSVKGEVDGPAVTLTLPQPLPRSSRRRHRSIGSSTNVSEFSSSSESKIAHAVSRSLPKSLPTQITTAANRYVSACSSFGMVRDFACRSSGTGITPTKINGRATSNLSSSTGKRSFTIKQRQQKQQQRRYTTGTISRLEICNYYETQPNQNERLSKSTSSCGFSRRAASSNEEALLYNDTESSVSKNKTKQTSSREPKRPHVTRSTQGTLNQADANAVARALGVFFVEDTSRHQHQHRRVKPMELAHEVLEKHILVDTGIEGGHRKRASIDGATDGADRGNPNNISRRRSGGRSSSKASPSSSSQEQEPHATSDHKRFSSFRRRLDLIPAAGDDSDEPEPYGLRSKKPDSERGLSRANRRKMPSEKGATVDTRREKPSPMDGQKLARRHFLRRGCSGPAKRSSLRSQLLVEQPHFSHRSLDITSHKGTEEKNQSPHSHHENNNNSVSELSKDSRRTAPRQISARKTLSRRSLQDDILPGEHVQWDDHGHRGHHRVSRRVVKEACMGPHSCHDNNRLGVVPVVTNKTRR
jgi:hypothetical protein